MKTYLDCVPCFVRQALDAARMATAEETVHRKVLQGVLQAAGRMDYGQSPPVMGQQIHRIVRALSGNSDPYASVKDRFNRYALDMYPVCRQRVEGASDPLETALRLAIAGNVIDFGPSGGLERSVVDRTIQQALHEPLAGEVQAFLDAVKSARHILYIGDNAGEIVFDRLLIEQLPAGRVIFAVRGAPVLNDATRADAETVGMTGAARVIDSGSDAPGTLLDECSDAFAARFDRADLVIAKGQGNYETLSAARKNIFFVLKVKCPVIAAHIGCDLGSHVVKAGAECAAR